MLMQNEKRKNWPRYIGWLICCFTLTQKGKVVKIMDEQRFIIVLLFFYITKIVGQVLVKLYHIVCHHNVTCITLHPENYNNKDKLTLNQYNILYVLK